MKKLVFFAVMLVAATGFGAMVEAEMMELGLSGSLDFDNPQGHVETLLHMDLGYFVADDVEVGGILSFGVRGSDAGLGLGVFVERLFDINYPVAPYVAAALQYRFGRYFTENYEVIQHPTGGEPTVEDVSTGSYLLVEGSAGLKFFLTETLVIDGAIFYDLASEDVYLNNEKHENHDIGLRMGLSYYF